ncbi:hypothetical protein [Micavibrio aeruginosavorus]|uniref:hypothetical protein n=1 Tax=Micavibrio aeruginosavorus TaxID=349221 RepID=UPI003F4ACE15
MDLSKIFGQFAGQTLKNPQRMTCDMDDVLTNMQDVAAQNGLTLRVKWEGRMHDQMHNPNRVNVNVETGADGKIRITPDFQIG